MRRASMFAVIAQLVLAGPLVAQEQVSGQVELPLAEYTRLLEASRHLTPTPRPVPASHALGNAQLSVSVSRAAARATATVTVSLAIDVLESEWMLIPIVPAGTPIETATVDGEPVQLIAGPTGLAWATNRAGSYRMSLVYRVDAVSFEAGYSLSVPVPRAASIQLVAIVPGTGLDVAVIPSAGARSVPSGESTRVTATIPTTDGLQISWRSPTERGHALSRASYSGQLSGDAVVWTGVLGIELFTDDSVTVALLPRSVTLSSLRVDGQDAPILVEDHRFVTVVRGQGTHEVALGFEVPVLREDGPPRIDLDIPEIPVSRFVLTLPGRKEVSASPASSVTGRVRGATTVTTVQVPMTRRLSLSWSEAVPDDVRADVRANAAIYHAVHAEEGVLYVHGIVSYDVQRGETNVIELLLPLDVQLSSVESTSGAVMDWRVGEIRDGRRSVRVFLNRQLRGELQLDVLYDRSLSITAPDGSLRVPLMIVAGAQRQRGMIALLSSSETALNPIEPPDGSATQGLTRVGENQLPAFVRDKVSLTVGHTYKYVEVPGDLSVAASAPERIQAKFDAQIDTLLSLGEVTLTGWATVELNVKSGRTSELRLELPGNVNVLSLTAPSLRTYRVTPADGRQGIDVEFTQEMEGQFRIEVTYERILEDADAAVEVPTLSLIGAEVEQGRLAVEALSAVEVTPANVEQLAAVDVNELPRQLVLRTTNPILLAYKYLHAAPPHRLTLTVTRHRIIDTQEAAIDRADYRTLFTRDGLSVTTVRFWVRNSRKQFLRVELPEHSEIWSTFVDGKPEKPARAGSEDDGTGTATAFLVKILNSSTGFPLEMTYATRSPAIGRLGTVDASLPRPDILVTDSRWDVYLPDDVRFGDPSTNMRLVDTGEPVSRDEMEQKLGVGEHVAEDRRPQALRISVPASGVHYGFEKLYANQAEVEAWFSLPYASVGGTLLAQLACLAGTLLLWLLALAHVRRQPDVPRRLAIALTGLGALLIFVPTGRYGVSATPSIVLSLTWIAGLTISRGRAYLDWVKALASEARGGVRP